MTRARWTLLAGAVIALLPVAALITWDVAERGSEPPTATEASQTLRPGLVEAANEVCAAAQRVVEADPPAGENASFEERARIVERLADLYDRTATDLESLPGAAESDSFLGWAAAWHEFADLGRRYADAIRTGNPAIYEPAGDAADEPARALSAYARDNRLTECPIG